MGCFELGMKLGIPWKSGKFMHTYILSN